MAPPGGGDTLGVAVIGVGRMGNHHARVYSQLPGAALRAVVDSNAERARAVAQQYRCDAHASVEELLASHPDLAAASVAVPTVHHAAAAGPLLERRIACLVEKPLAPTAAAARGLADLAARSGATLQVGHTERFNPAVRALLALNLTARYIEVDRISPMTFRSLDVGVVMDMMIHDLDIVLLLGGSPLERIDAAGVAVLGEHEDVANARLVFSSGCVANLTASRLAFRTERRLRIFSEDAYVSLDYQKRSGVVIHKSGNADALERVRRRVAEGGDLSQLDYAELVRMERLGADAAGDGLPEDPLTAELTSFLDAARTGRRPEVDGEAGHAAVDAAERVQQAIRAHRWEGLAAARV